MLLADRLTIREDWQLDIVLRDLRLDREMLWNIETKGMILNEERMANLLYSPAVPLASQRKVNLVLHWPGNKDAAISTLRREISIMENAVNEYVYRDAA